MRGSAYAALFLAPFACACSDEQPVSAVTATPAPQAPVSAASTGSYATDRFPTGRGELVVSPLEHASVLFGWDGKAVYVDPTALAIRDEALPVASVIFVTEARFDHLDAFAVARLTRPGTVVVGPPEVAQKPMYNVERGPAPGLRFHDKGRGNGYVLDFAGTRVYLSGDTECTPEMMALGHVDAAFVSVSAPKTMAPGEAARCVAAFAPKVVFPYHDRYVDLRDFEAGEGRWTRCSDFLDEAATLDPRGDDDPRVAHCREQIRAWQRPFPAWW
jgi:L-ascorbate metabolism protein UlaG (beta-lactamase superfamily)